MNKLLKLILTIMVLSLVGCLTEPEPETKTINNDLPEFPELSSSVDGSSSSSEDTVTTDSNWFDYTTLLGTQIGTFADSSDSASCSVGQFDMPWNTPDSIRHNVDTSLSVASAKYEIDRSSTNLTQLSDIVDKTTWFSVRHCVVQGGRVQLELGVTESRFPNEHTVANKLYNVRVDGNDPVIDTLDQRYITLMLKYFQTPIIY